MLILGHDFPAAVLNLIVAGIAVGRDSHASFLRLFFFFLKMKLEWGGEVTEGGL